MRVAFLGPAGTYSQEALTRGPPGGRRAGPLADRVRRHAAVEEGTVERALVPIENSLEGAVGPTLDALAVERRRDRRRRGRPPRPPRADRRASSSSATCAPCSRIRRRAAQCARCLRRALPRR